MLDDLRGLNLSDAELERRGKLLDAYNMACDVERRRCEADFIFFAKQFWHTVEPNTRYVHGKHIEAIVDHLNACLPQWIPSNSDVKGYYKPGQIRELVITMPFRHMKSTLISVLWPAFVWTVRPEFRWLFSSYSLSLATRDTMRMRVVINSPHYQWLWGKRYRLLSDQNRKDRFFNTSMGYRMVASRDSGATGEGGDGVICFPAETLVHTEVGPLPIGWIVEERMDVRVWSLDQATGRVRLSKIEGWRRNPGSPLVRVATPGGSFRCTPDHRVLSRRGMVEACCLSPRDVLPSCSIPDSADDCFVDSEALGDASAGLAGLQDLLDVLLGELGLRALGPDSLVRLLAPLGIMQPGSPLADRRDVANGDFQRACELLGGLRSLQDALDILVCELGVRREASGLEPLGSDGILDVVASGPVGDVLDVVVERVAIQVSRVLSGLPLPDECFCDEMVDLALERLSAFAKVDSLVSAADVQLKQTSRHAHLCAASSLGDARHASNISQARDHVQPIESRDISPLLVSRFGHCNTSYCLTVESDHNFILCVGGDNIIVSNCDDGHNVREADSKVIRDATIAWWRESMGSRLNDPDLSFKIVVGQRVHQFDLANYCIESGYEVLNLPARYDPDQVKTSCIGWRDWRSTPGERLWPERFSEPALVAIETSIGPYAVACQLQQNPTPRGGAFIKREWFKRIDVEAAKSLKGTITWVRSWDLALSKTGNGVASVEVGQDAGGTTYLRRGQFWHEDWVVSEARILEIGKWERNQVYVEAIGTTYSAAKTVEKILVGYCLVTLQEEKSNKVSEAIPWIAAAQAGQIVFIEEGEDTFPFLANNRGPWIEHFLEVFSGWIPDPTVEQRDDEVDAVSLGYSATRGKIPLLPGDVPDEDPGNAGRETFHGIAGRY